MRCTVFLLYHIQKKRSVRKIKHGKISSVPEQKKRRKLHAYFKTDEKTTLAQQGRYLLICLLSMLLLFLAGSVLILNRTQRQVYEQLEEISKLYTDELDNRFFESAETCSRL